MQPQLTAWVLHRRMFAAMLQLVNAGNISMDKGSAPPRLQVHSLTIADRQKDYRAPSQQDRVKVRLVFVQAVGAVCAVFRCVWMHWKQNRHCFVSGSHTGCCMHRGGAARKVHRAARM